MADSKNNITTSFKVDISNLKSGISEANRQIKLANAEFKAAASSLDFMADSADGIKAKLDQLNKVLNNQEKILDAYEKQLELTVKEQGEGSKAADDLRIKIANQKAAINDTKKQINDYNAKLDDAEKEMNDGAKAADNLADNVEDAGKEAKDAGDGFTVMKGVLADLASTAIKAVVNGFKDMASAAKEAYKAYDEGADNVIRATGATGEAAKDLKRSYTNVSKTIVADMGDIGNALGEVNTRYGLTGEELEKLTTLYLKFSEITGAEVVGAVDDTQKALATYGKGAESAGAFLDALAKTAQATGVNTATLTKGIIGNATAFQEMGLTLEQSVAFMGQLETSGADAETVLNGMRKALKSSAKDGKDLNASLLELQAAIENGTSGMDGLNAAYELFGKSGDQIYGAIKNGTVSFKDLTKTAESSLGTVEATFDETKSGADELSLAVQSLKTDVGEAIDEVLSENSEEISEAIKKISESLSELIPKIKDAILFVINNKEKIVATLAAITAGLVAMNVANTIMKVVTAFKALKEAEDGLTLAQKLLNAVMAANPIGILISLVTALVTYFIVLWNTSEDFRQFWIDLWDTLKESVGAAVEKIGEIFGAAWDGIKAVWESAKEFFPELWESIKNVFSNVDEWFSEHFGGAWDKIKEIFGGVGEWFRGIFEGARDIIAGIWESVTEIVKAPINFLIRGLNKFIDQLNKIQIPDWVPGIGGYGLDIPKINELERGGVLKRGQIGFLEGNGAEAVVPLENNAAWINATARAMKQALQTEGVMTSNNAAASTAQNITFNQYNTSPKALSRLDIYRATQNQLNFAKGAL